MYEGKLNEVPEVRYICIIETHVTMCLVFLDSINCYQVRATYQGAKRMKGIRASVYRHSEVHQAYYSVDHSKSIWYNEGSDDLQIALLFDSEDKAKPFRTFLNHWHLNNPMVVKHGDVSVVRDVKEVCVAKGDLKAVLLSDYGGSDYDSPIQTLAEFQAVRSSSCSTISGTISGDDPLAQFQCIERPQQFVVTTPYRCHLKPRSKFKDLEGNLNNQFAMSWQFHQFFDGMKTKDDITGKPNLPLFAIKCEADSFKEFVGDPPTKRSRIELDVVFRSKISAEVCSLGLKNGSTRISDTHWKTFVHVTDPKTFCNCLQWKYEETTRKWNEADEELYGI